LTSHQAIHGRCHCGNIRFTLRWPGDPAAIRARACGCSFCTRHGGVWTSHRNARLVVEIDDRALVSPYRFGSGTAEFQVCSRCGVVPVVTSEIGGHLHAAVNVNAFEGIDVRNIERTSTDFESEERVQRLERRSRYWIGAVEFVQAAARTDG
jgi:hypothetical protein